jgi:hypothetical protein
MDSSLVAPYSTAVYANIYHSKLSPDVFDLAPYLFIMVLWSIKIGPTAYDVSKTLLCSHSPYFAGMFNGKFKEGQEHSAVLEEIEGVVSVFDYFSSGCTSAVLFLARNRQQTGYLR